MKDKIAKLQKIKWTVFLKTKNIDLSVFTQCVEQLSKSVDPRRTEVFYFGESQNIYITIFSNLMEKAGISYNYPDDEKHALEIAKGEYIFHLTDHTFIPKNMLVRLTYHLDTIPDTQVISPSSSEFNTDLNITPLNLDALQISLVEKKLPCEYSLDLLPYCTLIKKEYYNHRLSPRENVLEVNYKGKLSIVAKDTIIYHFPEELAAHYDSQAIPQEEGKLGILYRIKLDHEFVKEKFIASLEKSFEISDNVYILDDNSNIKINIFMKENYPELWSKVTKYQKFSRPFDEKRDYNELISWAENDNCNWILSLEADEIVEDKVDKEYMSRLINPVNREIFYYTMTMYHFWGSDNKWRMDDPWGKMASIRLGRLFKGKRIIKEGYVAGVCGYTPYYPEGTSRPSSIRIKSYSYALPELCQKKQDFYTKLGLKQNGQLIDFSHLTRENGLIRHDWIEDSTVAFYTPVNKGGNLLKDWLDVNSYFADTLYIGNDRNKLAQVDLALISKYKNVVVVPTDMSSHFANGRNAILEHIKTKWIFQLDIDEYMEDLLAVRRMMDIDAVDGWMFSIINYQKNGGQITTETIRLFKNKDGIKYWGVLHETIDKFVSSHAWKLSKSPVKMHHLGYTLQSDAEAYQKMQRYLGMNLAHMKENPMESMPYYNVALHFLEDEMLNEAIKMLEISAYLNPNFPLSGIELSKTYTRKASVVLDNVIKRLHPSNMIRQSLLKTKQELDKVTPKNNIIAPGHCSAYFHNHGEEAAWLKQHILDLEKKLATAIKAKK